MLTSMTVRGRRVEGEELSKMIKRGVRTFYRKLLVKPSAVEANAVKKALQSKELLFCSGEIPARLIDKVVDMTLLEVMKHHRKQLDKSV